MTIPLHPAAIWHKCFFLPYVGILSSDIPEILLQPNSPIGLRRDPKGSEKCSRHSDTPADCLISGKGLSLQLADDEVFSATLHSYSLALAKFSNLKQLHLFKTNLVPWGDWFSCLGVSDVEGSLFSLSSNSVSVLMVLLSTLIHTVIVNISQRGSAALAPIQLRSGSHPSSWEGLCS